MSQTAVKCRQPGVRSMAQAPKVLRPWKWADVTFHSTGYDPHDDDRIPFHVRMIDGTRYRGEVRAGRSDKETRQNIIDECNRLKGGPAA